MIVYVDASCGAVIHDHIGELYCSLLRLISVFAQHWAILLGLKIYYTHSKSSYLGTTLNNTCWAHT
jgi:hypothetical protein